MSSAKRALELLSTTWALVAVELVLCSYTLFRVRYTEIDWIAYMQEVEGFLAGELNYENLKGDTGPLVYPAGFVYIYTGLRWLTNGGINIWTAQCIFTGLYLATVGTVALLYRRARAPPALLVCLVLSRRVHSIFILRLFNDGIAMLLAYVAFACFTSARWEVGSVIYSLAVGVKMNVLLFAPGLLHVYVASLGVTRTIANLAICASVQVLLGAPFLLHNWQSYVKKAFELNRVFTYTWSVNLKFLPESVFVDARIGVALLTLTLLSWMMLWRTAWRHRTYAGRDRAAATSQMLATLFESNVAGVALSRTLHYQFYVWFFHQMPFLLWHSCSNLSRVARVLVLVSVEIGFNVYPSTAWSSAMLESRLLIVLYSMTIRGGAASPPPLTTAVKQR